MAGKGTAIAIGLGLWVLASGDSKAAELPEPGPTPEPDPEEPDPDDPTPDPPPPEPEPDNPDPALPVIFGNNVRPEPTLGYGYQLVHNDVLLGPKGVLGRALINGNVSNTGPNRRRLYEATVRERTNWRLYGTIASAFQKQGERVMVVGGGTTVWGTLGAASLPVNDSWERATAAGQLPSRLIQWTRNKNTGAVRVRSDWKLRIHGLPRGLGTILIPRFACTELGSEVSQSPECSWPAAMYLAAGTSWEDWVP